MEVAPLFVRALYVFVVLVHAASWVRCDNVSIEFPPWNDDVVGCSTFCDSKQRAGCDSEHGCEVAVASTVRLIPPGNNTHLGVRFMTGDAIRMWDAAANVTASFSTFFVLQVSHVNGSNVTGEGCAFLIAPSNATPVRSSGSGLGLYKDYAYTGQVPTESRVVALKFVTLRSQPDREPPVPYVGLDVNSFRNVNYSVLEAGVVPVAFVGNRFGVWLDYDSRKQVLEGRVLYLEPSVSALSARSLKEEAVTVVSYTVDLSRVVNEWSYVGFSASTGDSAGQVNEVSYWQFETSMLQGPGSTADGRLVSGIGSARSSSMKPKLAVSVTACLLFLLVTCGALFLAWRLRGRAQEPVDLGSNRTWSMARKILGTGPVVCLGAPRSFTYTELRRAAMGFSPDRLLGEGGFGTVYRGQLNDGFTSVAIKRIAENSAQGEKEFLAEVSIIGRLCHRNLVSLRGWCQDRQRNELLLVYDYMPNGSLDQYLLPPLESMADCRRLLSWGDRYHIIEGISAALLYLHEDCQVSTSADAPDQRVVHRDLKPSNIMLDSEWNARLGDFGLARLVHRDKSSQTASVVVGTPGYLPPEYPNTRKVGAQSDVYSFGVVVLEVAAGRQPVEWDRPLNERFLVDWAWSLHEAGRLQDAADARLDHEFDVDEMLFILRLGLLCTLKEPQRRPNMRQVVKFLAMGHDAAKTFVLPDRNFNSATTLDEAGPSDSHSTTSLSLTSGGSKSSGSFVEHPHGDANV